MDAFVLVQEDMNRRDAVSAGQVAWNRLKPVKTGSSDNFNQLAAFFEEASQKWRK